ncbi:MAG: group III truncated hemoglobin [Burkholderiales bacterium]|nr:group III truncated hemoglobin [Burkholderiales bacterium]MDE1929570.1 group III truncated hemoglobin [Burkholderiales bacterium]MDE2160266.1 group III truncated hemoglobin [Burkholderiales bacterium]MDE2503520.1 group III truncated hemoglobin [Burkholderiales bacterium]
MMPLPPLPLDRSALERLVDRFYADVRADAALGPLFEAAIGDRWPAHLARMVDFWCTVMLGSRSFRGDVMARHLALPVIEARHYERWLALWTLHTAALFEPAAAARMQGVAAGIARMVRLARRRRGLGEAAPVSASIHPACPSRGARSRRRARPACGA